MKKIISAFAVASFLVGGMAVVGSISTNSLSLFETKAENETTLDDGYYLTGSFCDWKVDGTIELPKLLENGEDEVKLLGYPITGNTTFKVVHVEDGYVAWPNNVIVGDENNSISARSGINAYAKNGNGDPGIHYNNDNSTNTFNIYYNHTNNRYFIDYAYSLTIGENTCWMEGTDSETIAGTVPGNAGEEVIVRNIGGAIESLEPQSNYSNNVTGDSRIKVGGDITVYCHRDGGYAWVTGYGVSDSQLNSFCDNLLWNSISDSSCDSVSSSAIESFQNAWNSIEKSESKSEFINAPVVLGDNASYSGVVSEARTRYQVLINKGIINSSNDFTGITSAAYNVSGVINDHFSYMPVIVVSLASILIIGLGSYSLIKRRRDV